MLMAMIDVTISQISDAYFVAMGAKQASCPSTKWYINTDFITLQRFVIEFIHIELKFLTSFAD